MGKVKCLTIKIHTDSKKRRCAMLFASGDFGRYMAMKYCKLLAEI